MKCRYETRGIKQLNAFLKLVILNVILTESWVCYVHFIDQASGAFNVETLCT